MKLEPYEDARCLSCGAGWVTTFRDFVEGACRRCGSDEVMQEGEYLEKVAEAYAERNAYRAWLDGLPKCQRCGLPLSNPESQERGYGPCCWEIVRPR